MIADCTAVQHPSTFYSSIYNVFPHPASPLQH